LIAVMVAGNPALVAPTSTNGNVTIWVWLGASMLLAAALGHGGCEVLAISNLITGRRGQVGCISTRQSTPQKRSAGTDGQRIRSPSATSIARLFAARAHPPAAGVGDA
jgi:hypothetical protein